MLPMVTMGIDAVEWLFRGDLLFRTTISAWGGESVLFVIFFLLKCRHKQGR